MTSLDAARYARCHSVAVDTVREATCSERDEGAVDAGEHAHVTGDAGRVVAIQVVASVRAAIATVRSGPVRPIASRGQATLTSMVT